MVVGEEFLYSFKAKNEGGNERTIDVYRDVVVSGTRGARSESGGMRSLRCEGHAVNPIGVGIYIWLRDGIVKTKLCRMIRIERRSG